MGRGCSRPPAACQSRTCYFATAAAPTPKGTPSAVGGAGDRGVSRRGHRDSTRQHGIGTGADAGVGHCDVTTSEHPVDEREEFRPFGALRMPARTADERGRIRAIRLAPRPFLLWQPRERRAGQRYSVHDGVTTDVRHDVCARMGRARWPSCYGLRLGQNRLAIQPSKRVALSAIPIRRCGYSRLRTSYTRRSSGHSDMTMTRRACCSGALTVYAASGKQPSAAVTDLQFHGPDTAVMPTERTETA